MPERAPFERAITEGGGRVTFHGMFNTNEGANREPITQAGHRKRRPQTPQRLQEGRRLRVLVRGRTALSAPLPETLRGADLVRIPNHQNAVVALLLAFKSLHGATVGWEGGGGERSTKVLADLVVYSKHSFIDIVDAVAATNLNTGFKLVACFAGTDGLRDERELPVSDNGLSWIHGPRQDRRPGADDRPAGPRPRGSRRGSAPAGTRHAT